MRLQEQALSLPVGGGDTLQVLLNSQGSDCPFFDPPPSSLSQQGGDLALLFVLALSLHQSGQYFVSGQEAQQKPSVLDAECVQQRTALEMGKKPWAEG